MENDRRKQPLKYIVAFCIALTTVYAKGIVWPVSHMKIKTSKYEKMHVIK